MPTTLETAYANLESAIITLPKNNVPEWFTRTIKNLLTKTITIDEYNTLTRYVNNVISDSKSTYDFLEAIKTVLENIDASYVIGAQKNGQDLNIVNRKIQIPSDTIIGAQMNGQDLTIVNKKIQIPATSLTAGYGIAISDQGVISVDLDDADEEEF